MENTTGTLTAASASFHTKVEEMLTLLTTTQMEHSMSDCGKLTTSTGLDATEEAPHAHPIKVLIVLSKSTKAAETAGDHGAPTLPVDVDQLYRANLSYHLHIKPKEDN